MELRHSFTIPVGLEETWAHFQDISGVAECFPGAKVTSAEGDDFTGTAKVKLGPVALQYSGSGSFLERDEAGHRMVFEAKGKDKRGNGTAGALVTLTFAEAADGTRADVVTDLSVTGKPAQFGSRMLQEVSDKLLGQFVDCLQQQVGAGSSDEPGEASSSAEAAAAATGTDPDEVAGDAAWAEGAAARQAALAAGDPLPTSGSAEGPSTGTSSPPKPSSSPRASSPSTKPSSSPSPAGSAESGDDALDLGATVLPVIARMYGKQAGVGLLVLLVLWWVGRRLSR